MTLGDVVFDIGGGIRKNRTFRQHRQAARQAAHLLRT